MPRFRSLLASRMLLPVALVSAVAVAVPSVAVSATPLPSTSAPSGAGVDPSPSSSGVVPGEVVVALRPGVDAKALARRSSSRVIRTIPGQSNVVVMKGAAGRERATADRLEGSAGVRWAVANAVLHSLAPPNDPLFPLQFNLQTRQAVAGGSNWEPVNGTGIDGTGVTVAVLDTGVTPNDDLDGVLPGFDFVENDADPSDEDGHGTHITGTIAQSANNDVAAAGVAPGASILPVRVLDAAGSGTVASVVAGLSYAVDRGAKVANLSFGGSTESGLCAVIDETVAAGVVVVAAAGNDGQDVDFPAACPSAIAVSATTIEGTLADYSSRGPQVDIAAPGGDDLDRDANGAPDAILQRSVFDGKLSDYFLFGTSSSAPHVAGAAALLLQRDPSLSVARVREILSGTAVDLGAPGPDPGFGAGLLDITAAVSALGPLPVPPANSPAPAPAPGPDAGGSTVDRLAGSSRYGTAVAASQAGFSGGAAEVFLASGSQFPDALATGALSGQQPGPLLLSAPCSLPSETAAELTRLGPERVSVIGGEGAVCAEVADQVGALTGAAVRRIAGADRFATSVALSQAGFPTPSALSARAVGTVYLASGTNFADGLSGAALAANGDGPLLLTAPCSLPGSVGEELRRLDPQRVVVLGGPGAVCEAVATEAGRQATAEVTRVAGADRYDTAAEAAGAFPSAEVVFVASGLAFPDGLAAGPLAALEGAPLLLVPGCDVPPSVQTALDRLAPARTVVLGGEAAVCEAVAEQLGRPA